MNEIDKLSASIFLTISFNISQGMLKDQTEMQRNVRLFSARVKKKNL